jgi:CRP-like cAMP-binding protein
LQIIVDDDQPLKKSMAFSITKYHFRSNLLLRNVHGEFLDELSTITEQISAEKKSVIYKEGSLPFAVYCVTKGKVKIEQLTETGDSRIVYIYTPGEYFGFRPLLSGDRHPVSATAIEDCELQVFDGKCFIDIVKRSQILSFNLIEILSFEFNVWVNLISSLSHKSAKERVALILLILHEKYKGADSKSEITMSKKDIASYAETTEETVVRIIHFFEQEKILKNQGRKISLINNHLLEIITKGF